MDLKSLEHRLLEHPDLSHLSADDQFFLLKERAKHIMGEDRLRAGLRACRQDQRPLRIKYGIDATGLDIHLGHAVPLFVLRRLQKMGHHVVLLIGDFTARVGDPSGRIATRPMLSEAEIKANAQRYAAQAGKILDMSRTEVRFNSEWLNRYPLPKFFSVLSGLSVSTALQRDDFRKRESITRAEMLYSTLMALDSVELKSELELGGDDQLLNFYDAERVMENEGLPPESAVTTDILVGTTGGGQKMSKSVGNYISILAEPGDMFGKIMSIPDEIVEAYFKLLTDMTDADWKTLRDALADGSLHPMEVKRLLARTVVADLNGRKAADDAEHDFDTRIVEKRVPDDTPVITVPSDKAVSWMLLLRSLGLSQAKTGSAAIRLLKGGGVHLISADGVETTVMDETPLPAVGETATLRIGKRTYAKFVIQGSA